MNSRFEAPGWGPWSEKADIAYCHAPAWALDRIIALRVHLDASGTQNGPLRVVPGSQTCGVLTDEEVLELAHSRGFIDCLVSKGGVIAMKPLLIHASSKTNDGEPRRVLHIEYATSLELAADIRLAVA